MKGNTMNKLLATLVAGLIATSAFAADAPKAVQGAAARSAARDRAYTRYSAGTRRDKDRS